MSSWKLNSVTGRLVTQDGVFDIPMEPVEGKPGVFTNTSEVTVSADAFLTFTYDIEMDPSE